MPLQLEPGITKNHENLILKNPPTLTCHTHLEIKNMLSFLLPRSHAHILHYIYIINQESHCLTSNSGELERECRQVEHAPFCHQLHLGDQKGGMQEVFRKGV